jgi:hypothetical protein
MGTRKMRPKCQRNQPNQRTGIPENGAASSMVQVSPLRRSRYRLRGTAAAIIGEIRRAKEETERPLLRERGLAGGECCHHCPLRARDKNRLSVHKEKEAPSFSF